tara:strand:+ start:224 stop:394 length:171 start_codon:yes stop_codon:yes gene_type:complete
MSKWVEETMYEIHIKVEKLGLRKEFDKQLRKMATQDKHKTKTSCERWEYALNKVKK